MIIIDYSAISISNIVTQKIDADEDLIRHMILNSIRMYSKKFKKAYGNVVIAADSYSWRRDYYPHYKANRRKDRSESDTDWEEIFRIIKLVLNEIDEHTPYKVIKVHGCEADDIIGTLVEYTQEFIKSDLIGKDEKVMIVSADKDFIQLQQYSNVKQFSPMQKKVISHENPKRYLIEHIFRGDSSDGVPNVLSDDDTFVTGTRQSRLTQKKIDKWIEGIDNLSEVMSTSEFKNYTRNRKLIDLTCVPDELKREVIEQFETKENVPKSKLLPYLISKRCKQLISCIEDF